jgi:hypothetical protein
LSVFVKLRDLEEMICRIGEVRKTDTEALLNTRNAHCKVYIFYLIRGQAREHLEVQFG